MAEDMDLRMAGDDDSAMEEEELTHRNDAAMWLRKRVGVVAARDLPAMPSEEDFRQGLRSGMILCNVVNKIQRGSAKIVDAPSPVFTTPDATALSAYFENIKSFLMAIEGMGLPTFDPADLEQGGEFARVVDSVLALKAYSEWKSVSGGDDSEKFSWTPKCSPRRAFLRRQAEQFMDGIARSQSISEISFDPTQPIDENEFTEEGDSSPLYSIVCDLLEDREQQEIALIVQNMLNKLKEEFEKRLEEQKKKASTVKEEPVAKDADDEGSGEEYESSPNASPTTDSEDPLQKSMREALELKQSEEDKAAAKEQERINREKELQAQKEKARKLEEELKAQKEQERIKREKEMLEEMERARKREEEEKARKEEEERIRKEEEEKERLRREEEEKERLRREEEERIRKEEEERLRREEEERERLRREEEERARKEEEERIRREQEAIEEARRKEEEEKARIEQERIQREREIAEARRREAEEKARQEREVRRQERRLKREQEKARKREERAIARKERQEKRREELLRAKQERLRKQEEARIAREQELKKRQEELLAQKQQERSKEEEEKAKREQLHLEREKDLMDEQEKLRQQEKDDEQAIKDEEERERQEDEEEKRRQEEEDKAEAEQERLEEEQEILEEQERKRKREEYKKRVEEYDRLHAFTAKRQVRVDQFEKDLQNLKGTLPPAKTEVQEMQQSCQEEAETLGGNVRTVCQAAAGYNKVLEENRKLYNQVQDLKGSVRVYCRVRPLLPGQENGPTSIDYTDLETVTIIVPTKSGREGRRASMFNKVFGPSSTQEELFTDTQPLVRSVLDGFNICIFAYGQTGSGKTYTMTGPDDLTPDTMGVNFRALNDLFNISEERKNLMAYEISINMLEVYNDEIYDLLVTDGSTKIVDVTTGKKGTSTDATLVPVSSTDDVLAQVNLCRKNRAGNDRSNRAHSFLTVHVFGKDLTSGATIKGCMHLVDLAGSEKLDDSDSDEEAAHINKSLSALGDVLLALAIKSNKVSFKSCKFTQLLQETLGAQAKILIFVHVHPLAEEATETINTFKYIEKFSMVEGGCGKSPEVRELKEQIALLKAAVVKKEAGDPSWQEMLEASAEDNKSAAAAAAPKKAAAAASAAAAPKKAAAAAAPKKKGK